MGAPRIAYSDHANQRMKERRIQDAEVELALAEPDEIRYGEDGELIAVKKVGRRTLEVVYDEVSDTIRVITVIVL